MSLINFRQPESIGSTSTGARMRGYTTTGSGPDEGREQSTQWWCCTTNVGHNLVSDVQLPQLGAAFLE